MTTKDLGALLLLSALWGGSFLFLRVAAAPLGPVVLIEVRVLLAGLALVAWAAATGRVPALRSRWRQYLLLATINSAVPFVLIATAELRLTASLAAILNATTPLFGALAAAAWLGETLTARKAGGLALGFAGVAVLVGWNPLPLSGAVLLSVGASLLAAACYGLAGVYTKAAFAGVPPLALATGSQLGAAALLAPLVPFAPPAAAPSPTVVLCVLALALGSTALAYLLYFRLIVNVGPTRTMLVTYLAPIFGTIWGALFLAEPVGAGTVAGFALILASVGLVTGVRPRRPRAALAPAADGD